MLLSMKQMQWIQITLQSPNIARTGANPQSFQMKSNELMDAEMEDVNTGISDMAPQSIPSATMAISSEPMHSGQLNQCPIVRTEPLVA